ncbi:MAG: hypothetical protein WBZ36_07700 [Candidatus Nitrosopolaris sp.]
MAAEAKRQIVLAMSTIISPSLRSHFIFLKAVVREILLFSAIISLKDFEWSITQFIIFNISSSAKAVRSGLFILWLLMIMDYSKTIEVHILVLSVLYNLVQISTINIDQNSDENSALWQSLNK